MLENMQMLGLNSLGKIHVHLHPEWHWRHADVEIRIAQLKYRSTYSLSDIEDMQMLRSKFPHWNTASSTHHGDEKNKKISFMSCSNNINLLTFLPSMKEESQQWSLDFTAQNHFTHPLYKGIGKSNFIIINWLCIPSKPPMPEDAISTSDLYVQQYITHFLHTKTH